MLKLNSNHNSTYSNQQMKSIILIGVILIIVLTQFGVVYPHASAETYALANLNVGDLYDMSLNGNGQFAVEQVADVAFNLGYWQPAPGDTVIYDDLMSIYVRGAIVDYDEVPAICRDKFQVPDPVECVEVFRRQETQVRFGRSFFSTPNEDGSVSLRAADDIVSTYIEEVGHSWQEYAFETDGVMSGERLHTTTMADAEYWKNGREYQVKMYLLGLDGNILELTAQERTNLVKSVCLEDGKDYAYPIGHEVPTYGPPNDWPYPEFWPTTTPTYDEHTAFCGGELP